MVTYIDSAGLTSYGKLILSKDLYIGFMSWYDFIT